MGYPTALSLFCHYFIFVPARRVRCVNRKSPIVNRNVPNFRYFEMLARHIMFSPSSHRTMKAFFDFGRVPGWRLKTIPVSLVFVVAVAAGCSKSSSQTAIAPRAAPPSANSATASSTPAPAAVPAPMANPSPMTTTNSGSLTTLQMLNRAMVGWMRQNHRRPQNFEDFASSANIQIPAPPAGKKYALNGRGFIVLVDMSTQ